MERETGLLMGFEVDGFLKLTDVKGDCRYGYIKEVTEQGFHLAICLHEEGSSAIAFETETGALESDWDKALNDSEKRILTLLSRETPTKDIAAELSLSPNTVRAYVRTLRLKLNLADRQQLIAFAHGMEDDE